MRPDTSPAADSIFTRPAAFEARMAALYSAQFVSSAVSVAYFPLWLKDLAFTPEQISVVLAAPLFLRVPASAFVSAWADRSADRVPVLLACAVGAALIAAGYFVATSYALVLLLSLLLAVFWGPHTPLVDSLALSGVRRFGSNYAIMRGTGSFAFLTANVVAGYVVAAQGAGVVPSLLFGGFALFVAVIVLAPRLGPPRRRVPLPGEALMSPSLLRDREFVLFILAGAVIMSSHAHFYAFGSIYLRSLGIGEQMIGWLWAVSVGCEVTVFLAARRLFSSWRPVSMLALGGGAAILRWTAMPLIGESGLGLPGFLVLAVSHALTFSVSFIATQRLMGERIDEERIGAAQALMTFANGAFLATFTLIAGPLFRAFGPWSFLAMALAGAMGIALAVASARSAPEVAGGRVHERP